MAIDYAYCPGSAARSQNKILSLFASIPSDDGHVIMSEITITQADLDSHCSYPPHSKIEILKEDQRTDHGQTKLSRWNRATDLCRVSVDILKFFDSSTVY